MAGARRVQAGWQKQVLIPVTEKKADKAAEWKAVKMAYRKRERVSQFKPM